MNKNLLITEEASVRDAMQRIDKTGEKILFIVDKKQLLLGSLSDGDIRRWILAGGSLTEKIDKVYNKKPSAVYENYDIEAVKKIMLEKKIEWVPVVNKDNEIKDVLLWDDIFAGTVSKPKEKLDIPVVIMAGGRGDRLAPFTKILPKALIPIEEKPIIEIIMDRFSQYGISDFYVSINHKSKMIKAYFEEMNTRYHIRYLEETEPLGTIGALRFLIGEIESPFIVTNCDTIIEADYTKIYEFHKEGKYALTLVGSMQHHIIPYGVCEVENGGKLKELKEKPAYDFLANAGMYLLNPDTLKFIPKGKKFNITELIDELQKKAQKVGVYPVSEKCWIDVGQLEEYKNAVEKLKM